MEEVTFTSYPKRGAKIFKNKRFGAFGKQQPVDLATADRNIKQFAKTLSKHESVPIAFIVTFDADDPDESRDYQFDNVVTAEDAVEGIAGIISRDTEREKLDEDEREDLNDLEDELQNNLVDDESEDEDDLLSDLNKDLTDDSSSTAATDQPVQDDDHNDSTNDSSDNQSATAENEALAPIDEGNGAVPSIPAEDESESGNLFLPGEPDVDDDTPVSADPAQKRAAPPATAAVSETVVTPSSEFENPDDIYRSMPAKYGDEAFELTNIKKELGFDPETEDKYTKELNLEISKAIQDIGLDKLRRDYNAELNSLEDLVITALTKRYNDLNKKTIDNEVADKTKEEINQLTAKADKAKADNQADMEKQIENEQARLDAEGKAKIDNYRIKIEQENKEALRQFSVDKQKALDKMNGQISNDLLSQKDDLRNRTRAQIVADRNQTLADARNSVTNDFKQGLRDKYTSYNDQFTNMIDQLVTRVNEKREELNQKREHDEERAEEKARAEKDAELRTKANELKARELDQKDEQIKITSKQLNSLPASIAEAVTRATIAAQQAADDRKQQIQQATLNELESHGITPLEPNKDRPVTVEQEADDEKADVGNPKVLRPASKAVKPSYVRLASPGLDDNTTKLIEHLIDQRDEISSLKNQLALKDRDQSLTDLQKSLSIANKKHKHWVTALWVAVAVMLLGWGATSFGLYEIAENSAPAHITETEKTVRHDVKPNSTQQDSSYQQKIKRLEQKQAATRLDKYLSLKNRGDKVDYLNGLLGQKDARSLDLIAQQDPTNIAKLYDSIVNNKQEQARNIWNAMSPVEKQETSTSARNAVALFFYNVYDWQKGFEARNL